MISEVIGKGLIQEDPQGELACSAEDTWEWWVSWAEQNEEGDCQGREQPTQRAQDRLLNNSLVLKFKFKLRESELGHECALYNQLPQAILSTPFGHLETSTPLSVSVSLLSFPVSLLLLSSCLCLSFPSFGFYFSSSWIFFLQQRQESGTQGKAEEFFYFFFKSPKTKTPPPTSPQAWIRSFLDTGWLRNTVKGDRLRLRAVWQLSW